MTRWGTTRPSFEAPHTGAAWVRTYGIWQALAGARHDLAMPSVLDFLTAVREAAVRERLSLGPADWSSLADDLRAAAPTLRTLAEDLADALDELVELVEAHTRDTGAMERRPADAGEGGARGTRGDDRAEEAAPSAETRAGRAAPTESATKQRARRKVTS